MILLDHKSICGEFKCVKWGKQDHSKSVADNMCWKGVIYLQHHASL